MENALTRLRTEPLSINSFDELEKVAKLILKAGAAPKGVSNPDTIAYMILRGREVGLGPTASMDSIKIIGGKATLYGDAALALVRASGLLEMIVEKIEGTGEDRIAVCTTRRKGETADKVTCFTVGDAKKAKLWGKSGPWTEYPERMLMFRARGFALRDHFGDVLLGLITAEEAEDTPVDAVDVEARVVEPTPSANGKATEALPAKPPMIDEDQLAELSRLRALLFERTGQADAGDRKKAWLTRLEKFGVTSARDLTCTQAAEFIPALDLEVAALEKEDSGKS